MTTDDEIGARIRDLRGNVAQRTFSDQMRNQGFKWSQATVWSVESGERPLRLTEADAVAKILGVSLDALVGTDSELEQARKERRLEAALQAFEEAKRDVEQARNDI